MAAPKRRVRTIAPQHHARASLQHAFKCAETRLTWRACALPQAGPTSTGGLHMNWDRIAGEWKQIGARVKAKWAKLTDDDLNAVGARKDALIGKIQERYGILREEAERQVDDWVAKMPPWQEGTHQGQGSQKTR
jgi:uncharacterized protein YjbJ (UPF0337 family)